MCDFMTIAAVASIGGSLMSGIQGMQAANAQADAISAQMETEQQLNAVQDQRERKEMMSQIATQRAELAARGVSLDSVTAVALGRSAAQEMSFQSQATRSGGSARQLELSAERAAVKARGVGSLLSGVSSAAGGFLIAAPEVWPGMLK
ncbi:hypothetical protein EBL89_03505 [Cereibacter sphaeroides]|uniref:hypothetical protein n=1 Tax=Cereibacter sphaeroides TaxID=1063 RepID=UPI000E5A7167|nr:hypothetical protein [Cereibacter sphaeroides]AZB54431.1 hypothetical protein EBL89_03505 [Cereibacter sphaeroides]AZB58684.1 hypothetical protein EBL88_03485 [Cereibacter sphaeroides]RIA01336.1 hypothetical protein D1122_01345 [Cereibacter sphaeroides]